MHNFVCLRDKLSPYGNSFVGAPLVRKTFGVRMVNS